MKTTTIAGLGLLLLLAQAPAQSAPPAVPQAANTALARELYQAAERAVNALPALVAPTALDSLADAETAAFPQQAEADYSAAFTLARALATTDDPAANAVVGTVKEQTEVDAVGALARQGQAAAALALARQADVAPGPLYSLLLEALPGTDPTSFQRVMSLVQECIGADDFPYRGAAVILRRRQISASDRLTLAQAGYTWAENETHAARIPDAAFFLETGHEMFPALDGQLDSTLGFILQALAQNNQSPAGEPLLSLLAEIDPARAASLGPVPAAAPAPPALAVAFSDDAVNGSDQPQPTPTPNRFQVLVDQAASLQHHDPSAALALANQASGVLDAATLGNQTEAAVQLAQVYQTLGDASDAANLLGRCLDAADGAGEALDHGYANAGPAEQTAMLEGLAPAQTTVTEVYAMASRIDLGVTVTRAENSPMVLLKPLILTRLALIAQLQAEPTPSADAAR